MAHGRRGRMWGLGLVKAATRNPFSHTGQAYREKEAPFVLEEALSRRTYQHHVITELYPLRLQKPRNG